MRRDLNVIPPERHGGLPEGAAGEEGEGRERLAKSLASRVSQRFLKAGNSINIFCHVSGWRVETQGECGTMGQF